MEGVYARAMDKTPPTIVGRYGIHAEIARGGMATVHVGRLMGPVGFSRTVAVKRLHAEYAKDPEFVAMFLDEARLAARVQHPNVVSIIDVVAERGQLLLVMDYVQGESLSRLLRAEAEGRSTPDPRIVVKIMSEVLAGLHAAHEARNERGEPLGIVHRDVSPQNIIVGTDGVSRLIDFGVAKAAGRIQTTRDGRIKGKIAYMAPEQIRGAALDGRTDVYAASAVLWECLVGRRLFTGEDASLMYSVLTVPIPPPRSVNPEVDPALDAVVIKGLQKSPARRHATALEMADVLEAAIAPASSREVARWVESLAAKTLRERAGLVAEVESLSHVSVPPRALPPELLEGSSVSDDAPAGAALDIAVEASAKDVDDVPQSDAAATESPGNAGTTGNVPAETSSTVTPIPRSKGANPVLWVGVGLAVVAVAGGTWVVASASKTPTPAGANVGAAVVSAPPEQAPAAAPSATVAPATSSSSSATVPASAAVSSEPLATPAPAAHPTRASGTVQPSAKPSGPKKPKYTRD